MAGGFYEDPSIPGIDWYGASAEEIIEEADLVIIVTCIDYERLRGPHRGDYIMQVDEILYPRYNTEYHPFLKLSLEKARSIAADTPSRP